MWKKISRRTVNFNLNRNYASTSNTFFILIIWCLISNCRKCCIQQINLASTSFWQCQLFCCPCCWRTEIELTHAWRRMCSIIIRIWYNGVAGRLRRRTLYPSHRYTICNSKRWLGYCIYDNIFNNQCKIILLTRKFLWRGVKCVHWQ